mmetsp:Transcript_24277/g.60824  ORF Transcript_24277/g.60824 Transcript_24277/m.60824 type:complete len:188 (-) Transcript_24277:1626-2189(-)
MGAASKPMLWLGVLLLLLAVCCVGPVHAIAPTIFSVDERQESDIFSAFTLDQLPSRERLQFLAILDPSAFPCANQTSCKGCRNQLDLNSVVCFLMDFVALTSTLALSRPMPSLSLLLALFFLLARSFALQLFRSRSLALSLSKLVSSLLLVSCLIWCISRVCVLFFHPNQRSPVSGVESKMTACVLR